MNNIVERLRAETTEPTHQADVVRVVKPTALALEAADEIEKLRDMAANFITGHTDADLVAQHALLSQDRGRKPMNRFWCWIRLGHQWSYRDGYDRDCRRCGLNQYAGIVDVGMNKTWFTRKQQ